MNELGKISCSLRGRAGRVCKSIALLTRKTWSLPRHDASLLLHVEWWRAYYHFLRPHQSFQGKTPAIVLGLTDHDWSFAEFLPTPPIH